MYPLVVPELIVAWGRSPHRSTSKEAAGQRVVNTDRSDK